ncbi:hypothetical protein HU200_000452 [Digitaria exilis]|uniref:Uncharacterized protein n=1 Tax=Digitaria exilis TaxID=1010633 RepID=A0A835G0F1_9POAL|nr:hypothetical protein HU200_000452 [Digitaria exilis]
MFSGLQSARKESRSADAAVLEEQVHQMLREWRAELSVPSPASSLQASTLNPSTSHFPLSCAVDRLVLIGRRGTAQNSQGNNREASNPPSETLRLLHLAVAEEEDDATSKLTAPRSPLQVPAFSSEPRARAGRPDAQSRSAVRSCGWGRSPFAAVGSGSAGSFYEPLFYLYMQMYYIDHEFSIDDFLQDDDCKINLPGSNEDHFNNLHEAGPLEHQQFDLPLDLPPNSYIEANTSEQNTEDVFVHMSDLLTTIWPSPSQYLGPKCALWDCGRPVGESEDSGDYCNPYHAGLALNDDGLLGTRPVMRPRGIDLKDGPLFSALIAKVQGKNVGIPVCGGAATSKSPWNAPELFDLSLLEGESLREWLFFDTPRRAFESGNRKQRSLPDYNGRGWHESRNR